VEQGTDEEDEEEREDEDAVATFWNRVRGVAGDKKVWLRVFLRGGLLALLPALVALQRGYTVLIPTLGAVFGVVAVLTLAERFLASGRRPTLLKTGASLMLLAWIALCFAWLEGRYVEAVLLSGHVGAGIGAVNAALEELAAGAEPTLVFVGLTSPLMAGWLGLAGAFQICNRNWQQERIEALQLLSGHTLLIAVIMLIGMRQLEGVGTVFASLLCPFVSSIVMTGLVFVAYSGVEKVVEPELPPRVRRERARRERARRARARAEENTDPSA
tara:strand:- start:640 stop:1455 length:816 start_codon:yes stop_codon:yes gene_type:complete